MDYDDDCDDYDDYDDYDDEYDDYDEEGSKYKSPPKSMHFCKYIYWLFTLAVNTNKQTKTTSVSNSQPSKSSQKQIEDDSKSIKQSNSSDLTASTSALTKKNVKQMSNANRTKILQQLNTEAKSNINTVIIGRVDAGKSTTLGHLLFLTGSVEKKTLDRYEQLGKNIGKASFQFAWILDEDDEERNRGVTIDIAQKEIETLNHTVTLLDCPGHKDFIPNMISGASQADSAILVVDATETGVRDLVSGNSLTKEHILLARTLGVNHVIVAVNKMDLDGWNEERFNEVRLTLIPILKQIGFKDNSVEYVPCSGYLGENIVKASNPDLKSWYSGKTLLEAIDSIPAPKDHRDMPFRMSVGDFFKDTTHSMGRGVTGRIESGFVGKDNNLLIMPSYQHTKVKKIRVHNDFTSFASSGQTVHLSLSDVEHVEQGEVLCDPEFPIAVASKFQAQIRLFDLEMPLMKGHHVVLYLQQTVVSARIKTFISMTEKNVTKNNPRMLKSNCTATVIIETEQPVCIDTFESHGSYGRFALRDGDLTLAAGIVTKIE